MTACILSLTMRSSNSLFAPDSTRRLLLELASAKAPTMTLTNAEARTVTCPTCDGKSLYAPANAVRPFCCERCKNMDLGAWASESFRVPTEAPPEDLIFGDAKLQ
jgi:endogenous inhibitor of DNA gyrase (YacG/DUF329 family)